MVEGNVDDKRAGSAASGQATKIESAKIISKSSYGIAAMAELLQ